MERALVRIQVHRETSGRHSLHRRHYRRAVQTGNGIGRRGERTNLGMGFGLRTQLHLKIEQDRLKKKKESWGKRGT